MEPPPPDIQDTLERMERSRKASAASAPLRAAPAGKKARAIQNMWDLILIVGAMVGFGVFYAVVLPYLPRWSRTLVMIVGLSAVGIFVRSRARAKT